MECNQLAEVRARAGPTSGFLAMASGDRKAVEFIGRCVRVSRLSGGSQQPITVAESRADGGLTGNRARVFAESAVNSTRRKRDWPQRKAKNGVKASTALAPEVGIRAALLDLA
jgi:hypothetical protein